MSLLYSLIIFLGWLLLGLIANYYTEKKKERIGNLFLNITVLWFIAAIGYGVYLYIVYVKENPWVLSLSVFIAGIIIITSLIYKFIFPSEKMAFQLKELSKYRNFTFGLLFSTPILVSIGLYISKIEIEIETARVFYSTTFLAFSGLLVLVAMFSIFIIEKRIHQRIVNLLIQSVKGLGIMYGFTILLSILSLVTLPTHSINLNSYESTLTTFTTMPVVLFLGTLSLAINSICLTTVIFFQVVDVLKEEILPSGPQPKVVFEETRLYPRGWGYECSISSNKNYGFSNFREALEDNKFLASRITVKPINSETLQKYDVLVIPRTNGDYSNAEIDAIETFVREGGGLLLAPGRWDATFINPLAARFGVMFATGGQICHPKNHFPNQKSTPEISKIVKTDMLKDINKFYVCDGRYLYYWHWFIGSPSLFR